MYSESSLRKKAADAGYSIHKGFSHYLYNNSIVIWGDGKRETGYNLVDESTGFNVWGCYDQLRDHLWQLEDIEKFLRNKYEEAGLKF